MIWHEHSEIPKEYHAPFPASSYSWLNYDDEKAVKYYISLMAKKRGTRLHAFAAEAIDLGIQLKVGKGNETLVHYVNDSIKFGLRPEQRLFYSWNFTGTADAIIFDERKSVLRVFDLKTGAIPAKLDQLLIYDALFCLEYRVDPNDIMHDVRIYQNNDVLSDTPTGEMIQPIMDRIVHFDQLIRDYQEELD